MKYSRMRDSDGGMKALPGCSTPSVSSTQHSNNPDISAASLLKYGQLSYTESGEIATSSSYISVSQDESNINVSSANDSAGIFVYTFLFLLIYYR